MRDSKRQIIIFLIAVFALALCAVCVSACGAGNKPKTYTVSFIVDGEEYFSGKEQWDKSFVFPDEPGKNGYKFSGWYDGEDKITEIKQGYKDKVILTAKWEIINYTITYELNGGENN